MSEGVVQERLARIEVQVDGVREDTQRIEKTIAAFLGQIADQEKKFYTREYLDEKMEQRDKWEKDQTRQMSVLRKEVDKLKLWRSWLTGAIGVIVFLFMLGFEYGRQWLGVTH